MESVSAVRHALSAPICEKPTFNFFSAAELKNDSARLKIAAKNNRRNFMRESFRENESGRQSPGGARRSREIPVCHHSRPVLYSSQAAEQPAIAFMETTMENAVIEKTRELCQTILDQPEYKTIRSQVDAFLNNEQAQAAYQTLSSKGEYLQHKQAQSLPLSGEEIAEYESHREAFFNNPVARDFVGAQQTIHKMQETVAQYVAKTYELGRIPTADDFDSGGCGHGCGCDHGH
jgi:cell fate (sporulation/competence/biofilm development) regulator YlbF (YheA/YmcA/DUF963 family)